MNFEFKCPKCDAPPHACGKGGREKCEYGSSPCEGFICECDPFDCPESEQENHGTSLENPCHEANCYHCGWGGKHPKAPKGLQAWEKKALEAGWKMPESRAKELGQ